MKTYEMMIIISSQLVSAEREELLKAVKAELGTITYEETWGERELAYPMKGNHKGHYTVYNFQNEHINLKEFEHTLNLNPSVLRYLVVTVPEGYTPFTCKDLETGMEALREEKAQKREKKHGGAKKKSEPKKTEIRRERPEKEEKEQSQNEESTASAKQTPTAEKEVNEENKKSASETEKPIKEEEQVKKEKPESEEEKKEKGKTSLEELDKKLEKIFEEDDLNLGF